MVQVTRVEPVIGLEVHVELATRSKMFSRAPNIAHPAYDGAGPNSCLDEVVLGLPGSLPVVNREAVAMSMRVGLALGCTIASVTRWDRKSYFYPDMPKNYQLSQYDQPLCGPGAVSLPALREDGTPEWGREGRRIRITRAHLEEDAGKLLHEAPGGGAIEGSIVDLNRAGTPLLEIVTEPDFTSADEVVVFAQLLRTICRHLGVTEGVMQKGHMRFEPNINTVLHLDDGRVVRTPVVEVKNLNSFKALRGAVEHELAEQPGRWEREGRVQGRGTKTTRGWDDARAVTVLQREKEDAHDYRYFPDPDLLPVAIDPAWVASERAALPALPAERMARYMGVYGLGVKESAALVDEPGASRFFEEAVAAAARSMDEARAGKAVANLLLQSGARRANERAVGIEALGISAPQVAGIVALRESGSIGSNSADELFGLLCGTGGAQEAVGAGADRGDGAGVGPGAGAAGGSDGTPGGGCGAHPGGGRAGRPGGGADPAEVARARGMLIVRDEGAMEAWCAQAIAEQEKAAADVRAGKDAALGRLVGAVMKLSGGKADAPAVRAKLLEMLGR